MCQKLVQFGDDQGAALERLAQELGQTQSGIIRSGLALLQIAVREARKGNGIGIVSAGRVITEMSGVWTYATGDKAPAA